MSKTVNLLQSRRTFLLAYSSTPVRSVTLAGVSDFSRCYCVIFYAEHNGMYRHTGWLRTGGGLQTLSTFSLEMFMKRSRAMPMKEYYLLLILKYLINDFIAFAPSKSHPYSTKQDFCRVSYLKSTPYVLSQNNIFITPYGLYLFFL